MSDAFDFLTGEVSEPTGYTPVQSARYQATVAVAEFVDPVAMGWEPKEDMSEEDKADFRRPFPRLRWKIDALENGDPTDYAGRMVDQRLSLRHGVNPRTGRSYAEGRGDLLRLANGLGAKDEVMGLKLLDINVGGLDRDEAVRVATDAMQKYVGLKGVIRTIVTKNKRTGEERESVGKIVLPDKPE